MQPKPQSEPHLNSWDDFCRLVLEIIAEQSPCSQSTLFVLAIARGLQSFGDVSLDELKKLLRRCVQELEARGLVQIDGANLILTPALSTEDEDILELTAEAPTRAQLQPQTQATGNPKPPREPTRERISAAPAGSAEYEDILELTAEVPINQTKTQVTGSPAREPTSERMTTAPAQPRQLQTGNPARERTSAAAQSAKEEDILKLTAEFELNEIEDILELTAELELNEVEDILELTAELEHHPPLRPSKGVLATTNQTKPGEPTREEIIAAMRKFISDE